MYREGAALWLERETGGAVRVAVTTSTVSELLTRTVPSIVLLDLRLTDGSDPLRNVAMLRAAEARVVVHSSVESADTVRAVIRAGACGYVAKSAPLADLVAAIDAAARGESFVTQSLAYALLVAPQAERPRLSRREVEVLRGVAAGRTRLAVAHQLGITEATVKTYLERIRRKYEASGRCADSAVDLYRRAVEDGVVPEGTAPA
ncbi:response regulator transcription factor [Micromonospora sp. KC606]|uniref:LuxR C-terminal-related transcriptional regulator n=1 Tax=Micromonospora sp. KC606 TaxID=2530379 RepID=UPI001405240A|nr:response regulator transcription factor [Micromonospora sp. KC606]